MKKVKENNFIHVPLVYVLYVLRQRIERIWTEFIYPVLFCLKTFPNISFQLLINKILSNVL